MQHAALHSSVAGKRIQRILFNCADDETSEKGGVGVQLAPMRFKEYTWPHNPEVYTVEYRRRMAAHQVPFGRCVLQDLGGTYRVLRGEGEFVGKDAYEEFRRLAAGFRETGPGVLIHPVWQAERVYFVSLQVTEEPSPDYVRYSFEFWEDWDGRPGTGRRARKRWRSIR